MKRFNRNYTIGLVSYVVFAEVYAFGASHGWKVDQFFLVNAQIILMGGAFALFVFGMWGFVEGFWD